MREPIAVQVATFDLSKVQPLIDASRKAFGRYLDEFHNAARRSTRSKHGLMGPVGKILGEAQGGRQALEDGIDHLVKLLTEAPITEHDRILDRLDYGLYFDLRKKEIEAKETRRQAWISFLRGKYGNETKLSEAWREEVSKFDELYLPRKAEGSKGKKATPKQQDIAAFWESQGLSAVPEGED